MTSASPTVEDNTEQATTPRRQRGTWRFIRDIIFILLAALVISFVIKTFFIRSFYIPSLSMANTLQVNDRVIVSLLTPGLVPLQRGDVVVFTDPGDWLPIEPVTPQSPVTGVLSFLGLAAPDDNNHLIKRVIGLPGDHVACCSSTGKVTVNGVPLAEPYIHLLPGNTASDKFTFSVTVPRGDIWVMGDNRDESDDSAAHEDQRDATPFVPISDVTGRALVVSWPLSRWAPLGNYPATFDGVTKAIKK
jgi:signal peptidase I